MKFEECSFCLLVPDNLSSFCRCLSMEQLDSIATMLLIEAAWRQMQTLSKHSLARRTIAAHEWLLPPEATCIADEIRAREKSIGVVWCCHVWLIRSIPNSPSKYIQCSSWEVCSRAYWCQDQDYMDRVQNRYASSVLVIIDSSRLSFYFVFQLLQVEIGITSRIYSILNIIHLEHD